MKKYILIFFASYLLIMIAIVAVKLLSGEGSSLAIISSIAASFIAACVFCRDNRRIPTEEEIKSYAWYAFLSSLLVSFILLCASILVTFILIDGLRLYQILRFASFYNLNFTFVFIFIIVLLGVFLMKYAAIRWAFFWFCKVFNHKS